MMKPSQSFNDNSTKNGVVWLKADLSSLSFRRDRTVLGQRITFNRIWVLTLLSGIAAMAVLFLLFDDSVTLLASLLTGTTAMTIDFVIEHIGIKRSNWDYPMNKRMVCKVPLVIPILFFFCGILVTYAVHTFSIDHTNGVAAGFEVFGLDPLQIFLMFTALFFAVQYYIGNIKTLIFWALPLGIALYLWFPEPWMLAISIFPMYLDYYLEKRLVKKTEIGYKNYDEDMAINVSVSYFVTSLLIFGVAYLFIRVLN